jgi:hypothetical protein
MALHGGSHDASKKLDAPEARREALERYRMDLMRVRLELAELKRTGSQKGLAELSFDARTLSMRIKRFETLLIHG